MLLRKCEEKNWGGGGRVVFFLPQVCCEVYHLEGWEMRTV